MPLPVAAGALIGPAIKWAAMAIGAALIGGVVLAIIKYGAMRAELAQARQTNADNVRVANLHSLDLQGQIATLETASVAALKRTARLVANLERVNHAANSKACADSHPIRAALDGLRRSQSSAVGIDGPDDPGQPVILSPLAAGSLQGD